MKSAVLLIVSTLTVAAAEGTITDTGSNHWAFQPIRITDEYGANIVANPCHVHDYHATILHVMGIDHERLTYRYGGRDFRLTDVAGNVVKEVLT